MRGQALAFRALCVGAYVRGLHARRHRIPQCHAIVFHYDFQLNPKTALTRKALAGFNGLHALMSLLLGRITFTLMLNLAKSNSPL